MRIASLVGARPQFVKLAPICRAMPSHIEHTIIHSGQHYDDALSKDLFDELLIPRPALNVHVGSGSHAEQTARILVDAERAFLELKPDWVLVYGDTNTTLAAALAAAKLHIPVAHLEAGLRSFNRSMPEEINRILTDHISNLLLAPTTIAVNNLQAEGVQSPIKMVGDVMVDAFRFAQTLNSGTDLAAVEIPFLVATLHRAENTNDPVRLNSLIDRLALSTLPVRLLAHPRLLSKAQEYSIELSRGNIDVREPVSYLGMVKLLTAAEGVITDSGGLQKEAYLAKTPCLTIRTETEWLETLQGGWNRLDPKGEHIGGQWWTSEKSLYNHDIYGDGYAAERVIEALQNSH